MASFRSTGRTCSSSHSWNTRIFPKLAERGGYTDRRGAGGGFETGAGGTCSARRKAVRQSPPRSAGDRQLERDTRVVAVPAPGRCDGKNPARVGGGKALECRSRLLPRAKRRSASRAD